MVLAMISPVNRTLLIFDLRMYMRCWIESLTENLLKAEEAKFVFYFTFCFVKGIKLFGDFSIISAD